MYIETNIESGVEEDFYNGLKKCVQKILSAFCRLRLI